MPVVDLAKELDWAPEEVGEVVLTAMEYKYLTNPKRGVIGATITNKALRKLKLFGKHKVYLCSEFQISTHLCET